MADSSRAADASRQLRYEQVYDFVTKFIAESKLRPGDRLPSARELAERTGVSMISVRRGLAELEHEGKVTRHQGVGTFVGRGRIITEPSRAGELLASLARGSSRPKVRTQLLSIAVGIANRNISTALAIDPGGPVWEVRRIRRVGGSAAILERAVLPLSKVPVLDEAYLRSGRSLYEYLDQEYSLRDAHVEQVIEVDMPTPRERDTLRLSRGSQVVRIRGVSFDDGGAAFDCYEQTYRATDFIFYISGGNQRELLQAHDLGDWLVNPLSTAEGR